MPNNPCNYTPIDELSLRRINSIFKDIHNKICYLQAQLDLTQIKSGLFRVSSADVVCIIEPITLYYVLSYGEGTFMHYDIDLTQPVLGFSLIVGEDNIMHNLTPLTGMVGEILGTC